MLVLALSFIFSTLAAVLIVRYNYLHISYTADSDLLGIQKFHSSPVPRIGGVCVIFGVFIALTVRYFQNRDVGEFGLLMILASLPAFLSGFLEDITKKVGVKFRLIATILSAIFAGHLLGGWLSSVQVLGIDNLMIAYPIMAISITCFAVAGVSNAFNIIDGYNGLSSMAAVLILCGITYVAFQVGDHSIMVSALAMIGALLGFLIWNYPRGLIFLGDGGAYLVGFWIAELSILLTARHSEVAKWFPLLLCMYPIFETLFTIYRRLIIKKVSAGLPDASHLHQLIYRRVINWSNFSDKEYLRVQHNSLVAPYLWALCLFAVIPAVLFWRYHLILKFFAIIFSLIYIWLYWSIVRFRLPKYFKISRSNY
ncbi:glycosyltransferase family 4 protein [Polynucleobacter sp. AP-Elch-400A-B2]|uniref:MraY family glycosyltransferase n=1 Tax=Polynucleobacter sp. AP-Elch-400A-B2 TaxID=2576930 RepID=UPI001BFDB5DC|nr:glycosyltransferase [Polynucleobacter sp. AP-Elch-400A-B2]QWE24998.1 glycosyltransferase family 4 protein [Polynucleobacter sp. AP-Elch-400A-B2]